MDQVKRQKIDHQNVPKRPKVHSIWHMIEHETIQEPISFEDASTLKIENADVYDILGRARLLEMAKEEASSPVDLPVKKRSKKRAPFVHPYWTVRARETWPTSSYDLHVAESLVRVNIEHISVYGEGIAVLNLDGKPSRLLAIPFTLPGDVIEARIHVHDPDVLVSRGFVTKFFSRSSWRAKGLLEHDKGVWATSEILNDFKYQRGVDDARAVFGDRVECKHFGTCSGCQLQPLDYAKQLDFKRIQVARAMSHWSGLAPKDIPEPLPTIASPDQYGNRTKLTPHFDLRKRRTVPPLPVVEEQASHGTNGTAAANETNGHQASENDKDTSPVSDPLVAPFGFTCKQTDSVMDIEECPLATRVVNDGFVKMRRTVAEKMRNKEYKRGATVLLRDSLPAIDAADYKLGFQADDTRTAVSDFRAIVRQRVGDLDYQQVAHAFFQNNSAILPRLIAAIHERVGQKNEANYFIDAYCGSGLFSVALAPYFDRIEGIDIDRSSIEWAARNAVRNHGPDVAKKVRYIEGKSEVLFKDVSLPNKYTTVMIDPPRKGCDELFLRQLLDFNPARIVYLSCNVHTQARDIGWIVKESRLRSDPSQDRFPFDIHSVCAADLFPNTYHAEGLAVLTRHVQ